TRRAKGPRRRILAAIASAMTLIPAVASAAWQTSSSSSTKAATLSLTAPQTPQAAATSSTAIQVSWVAPTNTVAGTVKYTVQRTAPSACPGCTPVTALSCNDTGLSPSTTYAYTITPSMASHWAGVATTASGATSASNILAFTSTSLAGSSGVCPAITTTANGPT